MVKSEEFITNRLLWKAKKYKLPTHLSFFFKDLDPNFQQNLLTQIDVNLSGQPVLFFTKPTNEWTLICTKQVIGYNKETHTAIDLNKIKKLRPADIDIKPGPIDISKVKKKAEWDRLKVETDNGTYILHSGPGSDFFAMHNVLLMAITIL